MDRRKVYTFETPYCEDVLTTNKDAYIGVGKLAQALFGTSTFVFGLNCTPTTPASLDVLIGEGQIYSYEEIDPTSYSELPSDDRKISKQGLSLEELELSCPAVTQVGYSVKHLIQAKFQESDTDSNTRQFKQTVGGEIVSWTDTVNETRADKCVITIKAGTEAPTGTETVPVPDAGNVGIWVISLNYGVTQITASEISEYSDAPFVQKLGQPFVLATEVTTNNYEVDFKGFYTTFDDRMTFRTRFDAPNTGAVTIEFKNNGVSFGTKALIDNGQGEPLTGGELGENKIYDVAYSAGNGTLRILNRITANDTIISAGVSKTTDVTPYELSRAIQRRNYVFANTSGTDTYTASLTPTLTAGNLANGSTYHLYFTNANTVSAPTLNIDGTGEYEIQSFEGETLLPGDIPATSRITVTFTATHYKIISMVCDRTGSLTLGGLSKSTAVTPHSMLRHKGVAKAYGNFNGQLTTPVLSSFYNATSVTDLGTGHYRVNLGITMVLPYTVNVSGASTGSGAQWVEEVLAARTATSFEVYTTRFDLAGQQDGYVEFSIYGDLA